MIDRIGAYTIERELGRGGMGVVYAGRSPSGDPVAIKVLLDAGADVELRLRFETEIAACAKLRHPHVVRMLDAGREQGRPFLVMELLDGISLEERLRSGEPLPIAEAVEQVAQLAEALETVHRSGVLHRDLKPSNVMLTSRGPVITDFGLARDPAAERERITVSGEMLGTPAYMAPEQARGERHALGPATDVYGLGAILYQALTGQVPFRGTQLQVLTQVLEAEPERPSLLRVEVDGLLEAIVLRCLAKDPADRFPSAGALAAALEDHTFTTASRPRRSERGKLAVGLLAAIALGLASVGLWAAWGPAEVGRAAVAPTASAPPTPTRAAVSPSPRATPSPRTAPPPPGLEAQARALFGQRKREEALARLAQIPVREWRAGTWVLRGQILLVRGTIKSDRGAFQAALAAFRKALELDPDNLDALLGLATFGSNLPDHRARELRAEALAGDRPIGLVIQGLKILSAVGKVQGRVEHVVAVDSASALFEKAIEQDPSCREAWAGWMQAYRSLASAPGALAPGRIEQFRAVVARLVATLPEDARLLHQAGVGLHRFYQVGKSRDVALLRQAVELWSEAVRLEPDLGMAYRFRGSTRWELLRRQKLAGRAPTPAAIEAVLQDLRAACAKERKASAYRELSQVMASLSRVQAVEAEVTQALTLLPKREQAALRVVRAGLRERLGYPSLALTDLRAAGAQETAREQARIRLLERRVEAVQEALGRLQARQWDEALKRIDALEKPGPELYLVRGRIHADRYAFLEQAADLTRAIQAYRRLLERHVQDHREAHVRWALLSPKRAAEAVRHARGGSKQMQALAQVSAVRRLLFAAPPTAATLTRANERLLKAIRLDRNAEEVWATFLRVVGISFGVKTAKIADLGRVVDEAAASVANHPRLKTSPIVLSRLGFARHRQAEATRKIGYSREAERHLNLALAGPPIVFGLRVRGQVRMTLGRPADAVLDLAEVARRLPQNGSVLENLGEAQIAAREYEAAEATLTRSILKWPQRARGFALRATARLALGRKDGAEADREAAQARGRGVR